MRLEFRTSEIAESSEEWAKSLFGIRELSVEARMPDGFVRRRLVPKSLEVCSWLLREPETRGLR